MDYTFSAQNMMDLFSETRYSDFASPTKDLPELLVGQEIVINLDIDLIQMLEDFFSDAPSGYQSIFYFALGVILTLFVGFILVLYWIAFTLVGGLVWVIFSQLCPGLKFFDLLLLPVYFFLKRGRVLQKCRRGN